VYPRETKTSSTPKLAHLGSRIIIFVLHPYYVIILYNYIIRNGNYSNAHPLNKCGKTTPWKLLDHKMNEFLICDTTRMNLRLSCQEEVNRGALKSFTYNIQDRQMYRDRR
jgi:hypothetical protein